MIRGSSASCEAFTINLDRVAINKEEVRGVLLCVQDFVRSPHFTQRNFFSETGLAMLSESVAIADSISSSPVYAPWSVVASVEGRVEYVPVGPPVLGSPGPSKIRSPSSKRKRKITRSPVKLPGRFEVSSPPASHPRRSLVEDPSFASALAAPASCGKSRRSGRDRRAAPVFQMGFP